MKCRDLMSKTYPRARAADLASYAAHQMRVSGRRFLPVCDDSGLWIGCVTDTALTLRFCVDGERTDRIRVAELVSRNLLSCDEDDDIERAVDLMHQQRTTWAVITRRDELRGVIELAELRRRRPLAVGAVLSRQVA
jgi:CBS-domain-containing membrane protein